MQKIIQMTLQYRKRFTLLENKLKVTTGERWRGEIKRLGLMYTHKYKCIHTYTHTHTHTHTHTRI